MSLRLALVLALIVSLPTVPLRAQARFHPEPSALRVTPLPSPGPPPVTVPAAPRPTYWAEGALAGALVLGALGAYAVGGLCGSSDTAHPHCTGPALGGAAIGIVVGGTIGGLVGGLFPKRE